jgi:hypothetical protein
MSKLTVNERLIGGEKNQEMRKRASVDSQPVSGFDDTELVSTGPVNVFHQSVDVDNKYQNKINKRLETMVQTVANQVKEGKSLRELVRNGELSREEVRAFIQMLNDSLVSDFGRRRTLPDVPAVPLVSDTEQLARIRGEELGRLSTGGPSDKLFSLSKSANPEKYKEILKEAVVIIKKILEDAGKTDDEKVSGILNLIKENTIHHTVLIRLVEEFVEDKDDTYDFGLSLEEKELLKNASKKIENLLPTNNN